MQNGKLSWNSKRTRGLRPLEDRVSFRQETLSNLSWMSLTCTGREPKLLPSELHRKMILFSLTQASWKMTMMASMLRRQEPSPSLFEKEKEKNSLILQELDSTRTEPYFMLRAKVVLRPREMVLMSTSLKQMESMNLKQIHLRNQRQRKPNNRKQMQPKQKSLKQKLIKKEFITYNRKMV